jgi:hypothetical protein
MANLRSKYKAAKVSSLKVKIDKENESIGSGGGSDFLKIEDGKTNKFRLFPAHDGVQFLVMRKRHWLTVEGDDGKARRKTVLNSKQHGGTQKDIIEEYISFCEKNLRDKEKLKNLTHKDHGLQAQNNWIAYAEKITKDERQFGKIEVTKTVRDAINKAIFVEDDDEPIEVDPFTDLDEGLPLLIKKDSVAGKKKASDYYDVQVGKKSVPVSDESLEKFDKSKSLSEMYENVYTLKDFETALEGLEYFDTEHEIDLFEDEDWLEIVEEVKAQYEDSDDDDEDEEEDEKPKKKAKKSVPEKKSKKKVVEEDDEDDSDDDDDEDEEEEEKPKKSVKSKKKVVEEDEDDDDDDEDSDDEDEDDDDEDEKPKKKGKMSLDDIRARLGKKK